MSGCKTLEWSRAQYEPAPLDRQEAGAVDWFEGDVIRDIDCDGLGVVVSGAVPEIRSEDDDGNLTFGVVTTSGATFRIPYTVAPTATQQHMYAIKVTVSTSDARTLPYWYSLPIVPTRPLHA